MVLDMPRIKMALDTAKSKVAIGTVGIVLELSFLLTKMTLDRPITNVILDTL